MAKENKKKSSSKNPKAQKAGQVVVKANNAPKAKKEINNKGNKKTKKLKKKLIEHTAFKSKDKKKRKAARQFG
jgi:hypothetical protein